MSTLAPKPEQIAREGIARLKAIANPQRAAQLQKYFKESVRSFGTTSAQVRELAKDLYASIKKEWTVAEAIALGDVLFPKPEFECKSIAALILCRFSKKFPRTLFAKIKSWLAKDYLDNWAAVDVFCPEAVGALLVQYPDLIKEIGEWARHDNRWVKRAAIVSFLKLARQEEYLDAIYDMTLLHFDSKDDLIHKANGWLLREAGKRDMARLERFLLAHGPAIPRTTLRYAIERFEEKKRRQLLLQTKN